MAASTEHAQHQVERKKSRGSQVVKLESKDWISEEELYTEGSNDEDDMALRMKRRDQHEGERKKTEKQKRDCVPEVPAIKTPERGAGDENLRIIKPDDEDDSFLWRPCQGNFHLRTQHSDLDLDSAPQKGDLRATQSGRDMTLSEAYSSMHRLDALLKESDKKVKVAQAETLRAQLRTRAQLQQLRDEAGGSGGGTSIALARNWDAFMRLCPAPLQHPADEADSNGLAEDSILSKITEHSDEDSEEGSAGEAGEAGCLHTERLAITDQEKLRLSKLLRDLDGEDGDALDHGYTFDEAARRCLEDIDRKLLELNVAGGSESDLAATPQGVAAAGATRRQRLDDIDRCLEVLAKTALEDVEPVGEEEVSRLLGQGGDDGEVEALEAVQDPAVLEELLSEARRELPRFQFRHGVHPDPAGIPE